MADERDAERRKVFQNGLNSAQDLVGDVKEGWREKDMNRFRSMVKKLSAPSLELTEADLLGYDPRGGRQVLTEQVPAYNEEHLLPEERQAFQIQKHRNARFAQPETKPLRQMLTENDSVEPAGSDWSVKEFLGETKSGASIPVYKVVNDKMGFTHNKLFRIEAIAEKIALILNESGNFNDPRVVSIINSYDKRDRLLREARQLEQSGEGKALKQERLKQIKSEIVQLDYKLGI